MHNPFNPLWLYAVWWDDSHGGQNEELEPGEGDVQPAEVMTVGYISDVGERGIKVAPEQTSPTPHYRGHTTIIGWDNIYATKVVRKQSLWKRPKRNVFGIPKAPEPETS